MESPATTNFITSETDLFDSVREFNLKPEFWRPVLSSAPKYFLHIHHKGKHNFGLSKFCVFKDISAEDYITTYRYRTDGGYAQKTISATCGRPWISYKDTLAELQQAFIVWIHEFFPSYDPFKANFITIEIPAGFDRKKRGVTPEKLKEVLELKSLIGEVGELIAYRYEKSRLAESGCKKPGNSVFHVSKTNAASGYDILTNTANDQRYIEVKSSLRDSNEFYITENEYDTLMQLGDQAYIYRVVIEDLSSYAGYVAAVIQNPAKTLGEKGTLKPVAYKVTL